MYGHSTTYVNLVRRDIDGSFGINDLKDFKFKGKNCTGVFA